MGAGVSASRETDASPSAFSASPRVLAGTGRCRRVAFASPSKTFLPPTAFLLPACRHEHPPRFWFPGPAAARGWPSGALLAAAQPLAAFTPVQRPPTRLPALSSQHPPACHVLRRPLPPPPLHVPPDPPSTMSVLGSGNVLRGGLRPRDAHTRTTHRGRSLPTPTAPAGGVQNPFHCVKIPLRAESRS